MLLLLTSRTWTRGAASAALAEEVSAAMTEKVHILLAHEMVGVGGQAGRFGCDFSQFFQCADGATPAGLLARNVYGEIAVALKGGAWRAASLVLLDTALRVDSDDEPAPQEEGRRRLAALMRMRDTLWGGRLGRMPTFRRRRSAEQLPPGVAVEMQQPQDVAELEAVVAEVPTD